jgi:hypothetical protein
LEGVGDVAGGPEVALGEPGEGLADDLAKENVVLDKG